MHAVPQAIYTRRVFASPSRLQTEHDETVHNQRSNSNQSYQDQSSRVQASQDNQTDFEIQRQAVKVAESIWRVISWRKRVWRGRRRVLFWTIANNLLADDISQQPGRSQTSAKGRAVTQGPFPEAWNDLPRLASSRRSRDYLRNWRADSGSRRNWCLIALTNQADETDREHFSRSCQDSFHSRELSAVDIPAGREHR